MIHSDDWMAVSRYWAGVSRARVEDILGGLTVDGPLLAAESAAAAPSETEAEARPRP
jgi:hypothetical protein